MVRRFVKCSSGDVGENARIFVDLGAKVRDDRSLEIERDAVGLESGNAPDQQPVEEVGVAPAKSTKAPAFQFYPKDFLFDEEQSLMSLAEAGAYIRLMSRCWLYGSLPNDVGELAVLCGATKNQMSKFWPAIAKCFKQRGDGRWVHPRLEKERAKQQEYRKQMASNGAKGGRPKQTESKPAALPTETRPKALQSSSPISDLQPTEKPESARPAFTGIRNEHRAHALCGRVCLPVFLFDELVRRRGGDGPEDVIRAWAFDVIREWAPDGARKHDEPGDVRKFWYARYDERWPPPPKAVASNRPAWVKR